METRARTPRAVWIAIALAFVAAAIVHGLAFARGDDPPSWRHALFVAINVAAAIGVLTRPRGFVFAFAALTAQQLYSHGGAAIGAWTEARRIDVVSILVVLFMPAVFALLVRDRRAR